MLHVALYQPQIPPNTGNIARQCVGMAAHLHLVGPLGFSVDTHATRRAGLDYWPHLSWTHHPAPSEFWRWLGDRQPWLVTKRGSLRYDQPAYRDGDVLLFGSETAGLPAEVLDRWPQRRVYIPVIGPVRSYNLANAVAMVLGHASLTAGVYDRLPHEPAPCRNDVSGASRRRSPGAK